MSRHRDIRNMDFTEDYIGYDDVYGHSAEDDFYISPSHRQYLYNRDSDGVPIPIEYPMEEDIQEEDEIDQEFELSDEDRVKLQSCLDHVQSAFAPMRMSRQEKVKIIISNKFDIEKIMDSILRSESSPSTRRREKDETISLLKSSGQACRNLINRNKSHSASQNVEPQSQLSFEFYNGQNKSNPDSVVCVGKSLFSVDNFPSRSNGLKNHKENSEDLTASFLSKMKKNKNDTMKSEGPESPSGSFLSRMRHHSKEIDVKENKSPEISFLSRISKSPKQPSGHISNDISRKASYDTVDFGNFKTTESLKNFKSGKSPLIFKFNRETQKDSSVSTDRSHEFTSKVPLNGMTNSVKDKLNSFLERIGSPKTAEQTQSDISFVIKKQSLPKDFSKLKLNETKSMSSLGNSKSDDGSGINLTTALQKSNFDNLKFRPTSSEEQFDIPFVDCEQDEVLDDEELLECTMDLSHLATKTLPYCKKRPTRLGRIICLKYRISKAKRIKREKRKLDPRLTIYDFSEPSPDDQIKKHIRRNL